MRVASVRVIRYALPLVRPWVAASATITVRRGRLLAVTDEDGITGWGDCAPLPSSGEDAVTRAFAALEAAAEAIGRQEAREDLPARIAVPEVRWAVETALLDLAARRDGLSLAALLGAAGPVAGVPVNAALGPLDDGCGSRAEAALAEGFVIAKVKVGLGPVADEAARLVEVVSRTDRRLRLRLDANRAWSAAEAQRFLDDVADLPIDGVEEPLAGATVTALARLQARAAFPLAVDESLPLLGLDAVLDARAVRRLVIKPARLGGIAATLDHAAKAREAGVEVVLTSVVDSAVGVTAAAHLATAVAPDLAHGLATSPWLAEDVAPQPRLDRGRLLLPEGAGLGLVPDA